LLGVGCSASAFFLIGDLVTERVIRTTTRDEALVDEVRESPVDRELLRSRRRRALILLLLVAAAVVAALLLGRSAASHVAGTSSFARSEGTWL
jgi:hypothetical protein